MTRVAALPKENLLTELLLSSDKRTSSDISSRGNVNAAEGFWLHKPVAVLLNCHTNNSVGIGFCLNNSHSPPPQVPCPSFPTALSNNICFSLSIWGENSNLKPEPHLAVTLSHNSPWQTQIQLPSLLPLSSHERHTLTCLDWNKLQFPRIYGCRFPEESGVCLGFWATITMTQSVL